MKLHQVLLEVMGDWQSHHLTREVVADNDFFWLSRDRIPYVNWENQSHMVSVIESFLIEILLDTNSHCGTHVVIYSNLLLCSCLLDLSKREVTTACVPPYP